ncbi:MAG: DUF1009 domain-containing protein [Alphaproteobacteria bacterium]|nr:MAG: DUF1009 domain-containing protein [Alphaproteobacteria bacterium]
MALGVITANLADAADICDVLSARAVDHVVMGCQKFAFLPQLFQGRYVSMNLHALGEGRVPAADTLLQRLRERGVSRVVNAGTLAGLLDTTIHDRPGRGRRQLDSDVETQKLAALKLEQVFRRGGVDVEWLAETVHEFRAGEGPLNDVDSPLTTHDLGAAVGRARQASQRHPVACAWIDNGQGQGMRTFDTDQKLKNLSDQPPPPNRRLLIKVAAHPNHSPLDPPMIGPPTVKWAIASHVRAIIIDAQRGVIVSRKMTLQRATDAGIAVIGV